jgi:hypothetical protein
MKKSIGLVLVLAWSGWMPVRADSPFALGQNDASPRWNRHALTLSYASVDNPLTLNMGDRWRRTTLGSKGEFDLEYTLIPGSQTDIALGLSRLRGYATVRPASDGAGDTLSVSATQWAGHARIRFYRAPRTFPFEPWWGGGLTAGLLSVRQQERAATAGGALVRPTRNDSHAFIGLRAMAGLDIRPLRDSALRLRLQARYDLNAMPGDLRGNSNGYALQIGLQWSFWPAAF